MKADSRKVAYIDGANLDKGIKALGWKLDYARFRVWLRDKYGVGRAYLFIGLIPRYRELYKYLQEAGFTLVFKEVVYDGDGKPKGNCDADLVTQALRDSYEGVTIAAVLVTSDGDYAPLVKLLQERGHLTAILAPSAIERCSILLKRTDAKITPLCDQRAVLEAKNEKTPGRDGTLQGFSS